MSEPEARKAIVEMVRQYLMELLNDIEENSEKKNADIIEAACGDIDNILKNGISC